MYLPHPAVHWVGLAWRPSVGRRLGLREGQAVCRLVQHQRSLRLRTTLTEPAITLAGVIVTHCRTTTLADRHWSERCLRAKQRPCRHQVMNACHFDLTRCNPHATADSRAAPKLVAALSGQTRRKLASKLEDDAQQGPTPIDAARYHIAMLCDLSWKIIDPRTSSGVSCHTLSLAALKQTWFDGEEWGSDTKS